MDNPRTLPAWTPQRALLSRRSHTRALTVQRDQGDRRECSAQGSQRRTIPACASGARGDQRVSTAARDEPAERALVTGAKRLRCCSAVLAVSPRAPECAPSLTPPSLRSAHLAPPWSRPLLRARLCTAVPSQLIPCKIPQRTLCSPCGPAAPPTRPKRARRSTSCFG